MRAELFINFGLSGEEPFSFMSLSEGRIVFFGIADKGGNQVGAYMEPAQITAMRDACNTWLDSRALATDGGQPNEPEDPRDEEERIFDRACEAAPLSYAEQEL